MFAANAEFDVGLIVPLQEEFRYVREALPSRQPLVHDGSYYFPLTTRPDMPSMVAVVLGETGQSSATVATERLLNRFEVRTVAMVGVAGGLDSELRLGDVVIASKVDDYQRAAKVVAGTTGSVDFELSGNVFQGPYNLLQLARNLEHIPGCAGNLAEWRLKAAQRYADLGSSSDLSRDVVKFSVAPIASGDAVSATSEFGAWLKAKRDRKLVAIETEAAGMALAAHSRTAAVPALVVRGISDFADKRKAEFDRTGSSQGSPVWRRYATLNAVEFLICLLKCSKLSNELAPPPITVSQNEEVNAEQLEEFARLVARIYDQNSSIERLLFNAKINYRMIDMSGSVAVVAYRGVQAAWQQKKLQALIDAMRRDYPAHPQLQDLLHPVLQTTWLSGA